MASEVTRIQDQLQRAFVGGAWHGPSVLELLADVDADKAAARPIAGAHNIWELTLHIAAWEGAALRRLSGDRAELPDKEDWPPVTDTSAAAWQQTIAILKDNNQQLQEAIADLAESNKCGVQGETNNVRTIESSVRAVPRWRAAVAG